MANSAHRYKENAPGKYYVDRECIGCMLCCEMAPRNFGWNGEKGFAFVGRQPAIGEEEEQLLEALDSCPTNAIGADGLESR